jgi:DNA-binding NtrC family response regulator
MNHTTDAVCRVQVLAVSPFENDHTTLAHIFGHTAWAFRSARSIQEASLKLLAQPTPVLLCEQKLPDGSWKDLLNLTQSLPNPSYLIVTSQDADDRLWAEVLNFGAYDVLAKPFNSQEVFRAIGLAWRHWMDCRKSAERAYSNTRTLTTTGAVA